MDNLDFVYRKEAPSPQERLKISTEISLAIQLKLPLIMAPARIKERINAGQEEIVEGLLMRFVDKYSSEHNGLEAYCADPHADTELLLRIQSGTYNDADLETLAAYFQSSTGGQKFFTDDAEIDVFLIQYGH